LPAVVVIYIAACYVVNAFSTDFAVLELVIAKNDAFLKQASMIYAFFQKQV